MSIFHSLKEPFFIFLSDNPAQTPFLLVFFTQNSFILVSNEKAWKEANLNPLVKGEFFSSYKRDLINLISTWFNNLYTTEINERHVFLFSGTP